MSKASCSSRFVGSPYPSIQKSTLIKPQIEFLSSTKGQNLPTGLVTFVLLITLIVAMAFHYVRSGVTVTLMVNGSAWQIQTHQHTVDAFLHEVGLNLQAADVIVPSLGTHLEDYQTITVQKALPVLIEADGRVIEHYTHSHRVVELLREVGLSCKPYDMVMLNGKVVDLDTLLPHYQWSPNRRPLLRGLTRSLANAPVSLWSQVKLQRAVPLCISDSGAQTVVYTVARTVGEALLSQDIKLYLGDRVRPLLDTPVATGMHVEIQRAKPVTIQVDGKTIKIRAQAHNVAQLLSEAGIELWGKDYTIPTLDAIVIPNATVRVVRVAEDWIWETKEIPFETIWRPDDTLELDQQRTDQPGKPGLHMYYVHIVYEDGEEKERTILDKWIVRQPTPRIMSYGTKIVIRELETPDGVIRYWRKVRMLATSYTAATAGKRPAHPTYGITRLGWQARKGIVAVDPEVINLRAKVYVPGYGFGNAADTGGKIKGRRIDLCYDEDNLVLWNKWVDVYLLEPVPPVDEIHWVLPNYPSERR